MSAFTTPLPMNFGHIPAAQLVEYLRNNVPGELRLLPKWVLWAPYSRDGKITKAPLDPRSLHRANAHDSENWLSFDEAITALSTAPKGTGVGFVFRREQGIIGVDLDKCRDVETGEFEPWAQRIIEQLDSYTEISPSGAGVHILLKGSMAELQGHKGRQVEIYYDLRYFTVTGNHLAGTPRELHCRQSELEAVHEEFIAKAKCAKPANKGSSSSQALVSMPALEDVELIAKLQLDPLAAKLFAGHWKGDYPSQSEADLALAGRIARLSSDGVQIDRIFRQSALMRSKWDELRGKETYGHLTISQAMTPDTQAAHQLLDKLNSEFAVVVHAGATVILHETMDAAGNPKLQFLNKQSFELLTSNRRAPEGKGKASAWWLSHPQRREYRGVTFAPGQSLSGFYNLFRGFAVQPQPGDTQLFWQFVHEVIAARDDNAYRYLRGWLAHLMQHPGTLPEVALVLLSGQGTGKTTFVNIIGSIIGQAHYRTVNRMEQLCGRFNGHQANSLLIVANEASWGGNKSDQGQVKALITDSTLTVEMKGKDVFEVPNCSRLIIVSNEDWPIHLDADDRRFMVLDVSPCWVGQHEDFAELHRQFGRPEGLSAILHDLLQEDLSAFTPSQRPVSRRGVELKLRSASPITRWLYECLQDDDWLAKPQDKASLYQEFRLWAGGMDLHHLPPQSQFAKELHKWLGASLDEIRPAARPAQEGAGTAERPRQWQFPKGIGAARQAFEQAFGAAGLIDWPAPVQAVHE